MICTTFWVIHWVKIGCDQDTVSPFHKTVRIDMVRKKPYVKPFLALIRLPVLLGPAGLEPTTSRTSSGRSSQLSYEPIAFQPVYITTYFLEAQARFFKFSVRRHIFR